MNKTLVFTAIVLVMSACAPERVEQKTAAAKEKASETMERVTVPAGPREDPAARERERFDNAWRRLATFRAEQQEKAAAEQRRAEAAENIQFVTGVKESWKGMRAAAIDPAPVSVPITGDVSGPSVLKAQVYLDRLGYSVGAIDGRWGKNSAIAVWWYQRSRGLDATGDIDEETFRTLAGEAVAGNATTITTHHVTTDDLKGPFVRIPEDMYEKAEMNCLCYESVAEKLAENYHTTIELLELLNPEVEFSRLRVGDSLVVPSVRPNVRAARPDIVQIVVSLNGNTFNAFDGAGRMVFHAPTTVGSTYDPSPTETLEIKKVVHDPHFHYQPKLFHEVPDEEPEANLNPGPNSPVGVVWIALSKQHYGIHGTSDPESIGYASSHGCIRLTNWDAREVAYRVSPGVKVQFTDTRQEEKAE